MVCALSPVKCLADHLCHGCTDLMTSLIASQDDAEGWEKTGKSCFLFFISEDACILSDSRDNQKTDELFNYFRKLVVV